MSTSMVASAKNYVQAHPGCSHTDLENHLVFEKMNENGIKTGNCSISSADFTQIERLADELIY